MLYLFKVENKQQTSQLSAETTSSRLLDACSKKNNTPLNQPIAFHLISFQPQNTHFIFYIKFEVNAVFREYYGFNTVYFVAYVCLLSRPVSQQCWLLLAHLSSQAYHH